MLAWLLTNTTYGTWLPGDWRGSVARGRGEDRGEVRAVRALTLPASEGLRRSAEKLLKGAPIYLSLPQAETLIAQFLETAEHRGWALLAVSIMADHYHVVIQAPNEVRADRVLSDLKAYATRRLSREFGVPASKTWWTSRGSQRLLRDGRAVADGTNYVLQKQPHSLVVWSRESGRLV